MRNKIEISLKEAWWRQNVCNLTQNGCSINRMRAMYDRVFFFNLNPYLNRYNSLTETPYSKTGHTKLM